MSYPLVYDLEIVKAIPDRKYPQGIPGIEYCAGWNDHANMGISVLCAYDYKEDRYRVFCADNLGEFITLAAERFPLVGFNSIAFDNNVVWAANLGHPVPEFLLNAHVSFAPDGACYDLLREMWAAEGLGTDFSPATHGGYSLDATAKINLSTQKSGNGALAPILWQRGQYGEVIDYCMNDVRITKELFDRVLTHKYLISPKTGKELYMRSPFESLLDPE